MYTLTHDGVGVDAEWHQQTLWFQSQRGYLFFCDTVILYRLLGLLKWNHTHGWLYWWFTFTANSLTSTFIDSSPAGSTLSWCIDHNNLCHCSEHCCNVTIPTAQRALFVTVKWYLTDISFLVSIPNWVDLVSVWMFGAHQVKKSLELSLVLTCTVSQTFRNFNKDGQMNMRPKRLSVFAEFKFQCWDCSQQGWHIRKVKGHQH